MNVAFLLLGAQPLPKLYNICFNFLFFFSSGHYHNNNIKPFSQQNPQTNYG
jgi:hypothetical protein